MSNPAPSRKLVEGWLTPKRLARYVAVAGDDTAAVELYEWNIAASGAFYEVLGVLGCCCATSIQPLPAGCSDSPASPLFSSVAHYRHR